MKKIVLFAALCAALCMACSEEKPAVVPATGEKPLREVWEFPDYELVFKVADADGHDLLNPGMEGSVPMDSIRLASRGKVYSAEQEPELDENAGPSDTPGDTLAFRRRFNRTARCYELAFGTLSPADDYKGETLTVYWGDGTQDEVQLWCYAEWNNGTPSVRKKLLVNGKDADAYRVSLEKKRSETPPAEPNSAIAFTYKDAGGRDLLDPAAEGNILGNAIRVTMGDEVFEPVTPLAETRRPAASLALRAGYSEVLGCYVLAFGEFRTSMRLKNERITVDWGNGTQDELRLECWQQDMGANMVTIKQLNLKNWKDRSNLPQFVDSALAPLYGGEPGMINDFVNYEVGFAVKDAAGRDLLDPATEGNILGQKIRTVMRGKEYPWVKEDADPTRYNMPHPLELYSRYIKEMGCYILTFGEFSPTDQWMDGTFEIDWGDGTQDKVQFDCYVSWMDYDAEVHRRLFLNGVENASDDPFFVTIVK